VPHRQEFLCHPPPIDDLDARPDIREFPDIFEREAFAQAQNDLKTTGWRMESPDSLRCLSACVK
jgi:hypothetical protein